MSVTQTNPAKCKRELTTQGCECSEVGAGYHSPHMQNTFTSSQSPQKSHPITVSAYSPASHPDGLRYS